MDKVEFITKLEEVKTRLPVGVVPLYLKAFPRSNKSRVQNTIAGKVHDEKILANLEEIADALDSL